MPAEHPVILTPVPSKPGLFHLRTHPDYDTNTDAWQSKVLFENPGSQLFPSLTFCLQFLRHRHDASLPSPFTHVRVSSSGHYIRVDKPPHLPAEVTTEQSIQLICRAGKAGILLCSELPREQYPYGVYLSPARESKLYRYRFDPIGVARRNKAKAKRELAKIQAVYDSGIAPWDDWLSLHHATKRALSLPQGVGCFLEPDRPRSGAWGRSSISVEYCIEQAINHLAIMSSLFKKFPPSPSSLITLSTHCEDFRPYLKGLMSDPGSRNCAVGLFIRSVLRRAAALKRKQEAASLLEAASKE